jgi:CRISPR-associated protein Csb2
MFGIRVRYLRGSVTAADVRSGNQKDEIEWPPHPDRLFCALVQAWGDLGEPAQGQQSLQWLEKLPPPKIRCGKKLQARLVQRYVPVNDNWDPVVKGKPTQLIQGTLLGRDRKPRFIPSAPLDEDSVTFWWPEAIPAAEDRASLAELARAVASLGHPSCLVTVELVDALESQEPTWVPRADGPETLRIPTDGRLAELAAAFSARDREKRRRPPLAEWATYGCPVKGTNVARGHHGELFVFRLVSERAPLPLEATSRVIAVWRKAILEKADQPLNEAISGHAPESTPQEPKPSAKAHLALLPLADVGHRYARGHLLGLAAALPSALSPGERRACLRALGRVNSLTLGGLGVWRLEGSDAEERTKGLRPETWCRPSSLWASVTPVVFGKYPRDLWGEEAAALIREACSIAGLPAPSEVAVAPVAWVLGVPPSHRFPPLPSRSGKPRRAHAQVRLAFPVQVAGPVLVGAGRHLGYGLFRQLAVDSE